jgi:hypothetical protein
MQMTKRKLMLVTDSSNRVESFRAELIVAMEQHKKNALPQEQIHELLSSSYALLGNIQMYANEYRREMIALNNAGQLPED